MGSWCVRFCLGSTTMLMLLACSSATGVETRLDRMAGSWEGPVPGETLRLELSSAQDFCDGCSLGTLTVGDLTWDTFCQDVRRLEIVECRSLGSAQYCRTTILVIPFGAIGDDRMTADLAGAVWENAGSCAEPTDPVVDWTDLPRVELRRR